VGTSEGLYEAGEEERMAEVQKPSMLGGSICVWR
jgi:hypothetical protein